MTLETGRDPGLHRYNRGGVEIEHGNGIGAARLGDREQKISVAQPACPLRVPSREVLVGKINLGIAIGDQVVERRGENLAQRAVGVARQRDTVRMALEDMRNMNDVWLDGCDEGRDRQRIERILIPARVIARGAPLRQVGEVVPPIARDAAEIGLIAALGAGERVNTARVRHFEHRREQSLRVATNSAMGRALRLAGLKVKQKAHRAPLRFPFRHSIVLRKSKAASDPGATTLSLLRRLLGLGRPAPTPVAIAAG